MNLSAPDKDFKMIPSLLAPAKFLKGRILSLRRKWEKMRVLRQSNNGIIGLSKQEWADSMADPTGFYLRCFRFFHKQLPNSLRDHRAYFQKEKRGFGEDAFHTMWFLLFREFKPQSFLEIGVFRGQSLSLAALLQREFLIQGSVTGISPFSSAGDSVSKYGRSIDYQRDTLRNFAQFELPEPELIKAFSTDPEAIACISRQLWDCIYIDGNHDYSVALADWELCAANIKLGGLIVLDDSAMYTQYQPPTFASQGHPGPSQLASEIDRSKFDEILRVGHNRVFQKKSL